MFRTVSTEKNYSGESFKMNEELQIDQHSAGKSLLLHLLPGILIGFCYFALIPFFHEKGYPSIMALMTAVLIMLVPFELGTLFYFGKQKNKRFSLQGIVCYRVPIPVWQYFVWIPLLFLLVGIIFTLLKPVDQFLINNLFSWLPQMETGLQGGYSKSALIVTYGMVAVFGAIIGPTVEEFYFRGFLLPRMKFAGKWAPLLHSFLFALYHVFTPWMIITRTIGMLPLIYAAKKRNLYVSIVVHILANMIDVVIGIGFIIGLAAAA
jgi:membrane protease YdiL (CAAX protease family)